MKSGRIIIGTDKLGYHNLYYSQKNTNLIVGTFIPHIKYRLKTPSIDMEAWDEILNTGDLLGRKTPIKEIKRLLCGEKIIIERGIIRRHRFWTYEPVAPVGLEQYIEENNELLAEAMLKTQNYNAKKIIPLTGGQDSRRIVLAANECDMQFKTITQIAADKNNRDVDTALAIKIAKDLSLTHQISQPSVGKQEVADKIYKDYWLGFESHNHNWAVPMPKQIKKKSLIYDGIIGDVTVNGGYFPLMPDYFNCHTDTEKVVDILFFNDINFVPNKQYLDSSLRTRTKVELEKYPNDFNRMPLFMLFNHTRRNIAPWFQLFNLHGHQTCMPFSYQPLFLQSLTLNLSEHKNKLVQKLCMEKIDIEIARLPSTREELPSSFYQDYNVPLHTSNSDFPKVMRINPKVYNFVDKQRRNIVLDRVADFLCVDQIRKNNMWRTEPLKRMSLFIDWLETDEGQMPVLFKGVAPFVNKQIEKNGLNTP